MFETPPPPLRHFGAKFFALFFGAKFFFLSKEENYSGNRNKGYKCERAFTIFDMQPM
jgi:hypothetical protein